VYLSTASDSTTACGGTNGYYGYYIPAGESWVSSTAIYSDNSGTPAYADYYSNGTIVKYWDGSQITSTQLCNGGGNQELG
jgi:hypothetical protein